MARISTHMDERSFQVAVTKDIKLPLRKWDHRGTVHGISAASVAFQVHNKVGEVVETHVVEGFIVYEFATGEFIRVAQYREM